MQLVYETKEQKLYYNCPHEKRVGHYCKTCNKKVESFNEIQRFLVWLNGEGRDPGSHGQNMLLDLHNGPDEELSQLAMDIMFQHVRNVSPGFPDLLFVFDYSNNFHSYVRTYINNGKQQTVIGEVTYPKYTEPK